MMALNYFLCRLPPTWTPCPAVPLHLSVKLKWDAFASRTTASPDQALSSTSMASPEHFHRMGCVRLELSALSFSDFKMSRWCCCQFAFRTIFVLLIILYMRMSLAASCSVRTSPSESGREKRLATVRTAGSSRIIGYYYLWMPVSHK